MPLDGLYFEPGADKLCKGTTVNTPASSSDKLFVKIPSFGDAMPPFGPCDWTPHGTALPPAGTRCLVAFDEDNIPWVIQWIGPWT